MFNLGKDLDIKQSLPSTAANGDHKIANGDHKIAKRTDYHGYVTVCSL